MDPAGVSAAPAFPALNAGNNKHAVRTQINRIDRCFFIRIPPKCQCYRCIASGLFRGKISGRTCSVNTGVGFVGIAVVEFGSVAADKACTAGKHIPP